MTYTITKTENYSIQAIFVVRVVISVQFMTDVVATYSQESQDHLAQNQAVFAPAMARPIQTATPAVRTASAETMVPALQRQATSAQNVIQKIPQHLARDGTEPYMSMRDIATPDTMRTIHVPNVTRLMEPVRHPVAPTMGAAALFRDTLSRSQSARRLEETPTNVRTLTEHAPERVNQMVPVAAKSIAGAHNTAPAQIGGKSASGPRQATLEPNMMNRLRLMQLQKSRAA